MQLHPSRMHLWLQIDTFLADFVMYYLFCKQLSKQKQILFHFTGFSELIWYMYGVK